MVNIDHKIYQIFHNLDLRMGQEVLNKCDKKIDTKVWSAHSGKVHTYCQFFIGYRVEDILCREF